nr:AMP-binding protein [Micromonospora sp. DSM 115978]
MLDATLASHPEAPAVEAVSGVWSYAELDDQARRAAGALWSLGVRPGDRVAACLPNDLGIVAAFHGAQRIGAVWAGLGEALSETEQTLSHQLRKTRRGRWWQSFCRLRRSRTEAACGSGSTRCTARTRSPIWQP